MGYVPRPFTVDLPDAELPTGGQALKVGVGAATILLVIYLIHLAWVWWPDYGACLRSHQEDRHSSAWTEIDRRSCGKECSYTVVTYHPARDWVETVCDLYEYPDGNGPSSGSKRKAAYR